MTPIVILAAGASRRMRGTDKLLTQIDGVALLRRTTLRAIATGHPVFVALRSANHARAAVLDDLPVSIITVPTAALGLSETLKSAVVALPECAQFMILAADLPDITTADMHHILNAPTSESGILIWRAATADGKPGHPVLFDAALRPDFAELTGDTGAKPLMRIYHHQTQLIPLQGTRARRDLDTPEDWAAWRASR